MTVATLNNINDSELFQTSTQDKLFSRILIILLSIYFVVAVVVPFIEQVEIPREVKEKVPVQLAKIMLKEKQQPIPEKPKEVVKEEKKPEPKEEKPVVKKPATKREAAKQKAQSSGLAAMKDDLSAMRDAFKVETASSTTLNKTQAKEVKVQRKMLASAAAQQSDTLSAQKTTQVAASDALVSRGDQTIRLSKSEVLAGSDTHVEEALLASNSTQRSELALRRTLEANKSRLYARYNRALRKDPFLKGKVQFEIEISPSGKVNKVTVKSSELNHAKLERQLVLILRSIDFGAKGAESMVTIWSIDFLPS